jgi:stearoyl-CoA desaturase (delta-9 desaturase)
VADVTPGETALSVPTFTPVATSSRTTTAAVVEVQPARGLLQRVVAWFDSESAHQLAGGPLTQGIDWLRILPFVALHASCFAVLWVGWSPIAVSVAAGLYLVRMFAITGFYHRYFSHRAFQTSRAVQFVFAVIANTSAQRGPLWWAAHHRKHHRRSDTQADVHSPVARGLLESHVGWIVKQPNYSTDHGQVRDFARYPELRWLNRFDSVSPLLLAAALFGLGELLAATAPGLGTNGLQMLIWGFAISTTVLFHATFTINSLAHKFGSRRFETSDDSRNNVWLALLTLGEGWHNNHHHYPHSTRQGFRWWELDVTWLILRGMQSVGLVWELRPVPKALRSAARASQDGGSGR